jgi:hypothetical protein
MKATATACHRLQVLWKEPEDDHAVAARHRAGAPDNSGNPRQSRRQSLNNKLSGGVDGRFDLRWSRYSASCVFAASGTSGNIRRTFVLVMPLPL